MSVEYRVRWAASSNASFQGATDWLPWEEEGDPDSGLEGVATRLVLPDGLEMALEASGFEWWVETREAQA